MKGFVLLQSDVEADNKKTMCVNENSQTCTFPRAASYRAVEHAFAIHGDVEATLHSLNCHHSQTHRNKIKQSCDRQREGGKGQRVVKKRGRQMADRQKNDRKRHFSFLLTLLDISASDLCSSALFQKCSEQRSTWTKAKPKHLGVRRDHKCF